ncbi:MAG: 2-C-methyl-D-erythritol 4-phosphate cytidylyltransferase [Blautia sp.]|nr:2-C-methyl-D-erythritol 4-phosphate cytidylyltransferase [Blautia sp.]
MNDKKCTAIVLAAGQGKRMQSKVQKQFLELGGKPVLYYALDCFQRSPLIRDIVLVTSEDMTGYCEQIFIGKYGFDKIRRIVPGGKERYDSVYCGLLACEDTEYVFIHDGARPFITGEILERGLEGAMETGACVVGMPSKDTVKLSDEEGCVKETPDRQKVWIVQTPQVFSYPLIRSAYEKLQASGMDGITDDAMVAEKAAGCRVRFAEGSYSNIKITTPEDLAVAEALLAWNRTREG